MTEATAALARARQREDARSAAHVPIDYKAAQREFTQQKAALTRAVNSKDKDKVVLACTRAVQAWNKPGRSWPDDWPRWQCALDDVLGWSNSVDLRDLA